MISTNCGNHLECLVVKAEVAAISSNLQVWGKPSPFSETTV